MDGGISGISGEFIYDEMDDDWGSSNGVLTSFLFVGCLGWEIHGNTMPLVVPMAAFRKKTHSFTKKLAGEWAKFWYHD